MSEAQRALIETAIRLRDDVDAKSVEFAQAVRDANLSGVSLRALASALCISHQTVVNIIKKA